MNNLTILIILSFISSLFIIIDNYILDYISPMQYVLIKYCMGTLVALSAYIFILQEEEKKTLFKYKFIWLISAITAIIGFIKFQKYLALLKIIGPSKTKTLYSSLIIIITFILSICILKNKIFTYKLLLGYLCIICGIYIVYNTDSTI